MNWTSVRYFQTPFIIVWRFLRSGVKLFSTIYDPFLFFLGVFLTQIIPLNNCACPRFFSKPSNPIFTGMCWSGGSKFWFYTQSGMCREGISWFEKRSSLLWIIQSISRSAALRTERGRQTQVKPGELWEEHGGDCQRLSQLLSF